MENATSSLGVAEIRARLEVSNLLIRGRSGMGSGCGKSEVLSGMGGKLRRQSLSGLVRVPVRVTSPSFRILRSVEVKRASMVGLESQIWPREIRGAVARAGTTRVCLALWERRVPNGNWAVCWEVMRSPLATAMVVFGLGRNSLRPGVWGLAKCVVEPVSTIGNSEEGLVSM
jgi:hypothetical protein